MKKRIDIYVDPFLDSVINIFDNILYSAMQNAAKIIDFHGADAISLFHTVDGSTADVMLCNQSICGNACFFRVSQKGR